MYEYSRNEEWSLQASSNGMVRWVEKRNGPGWWHPLVLKEGEEDQSKLETLCGLTLDPVPKVVRVLEPDDEDLVCDFCLDETDLAEHAAPTDEA